MASRLSTESKKVNWNKLLVKGAIGHLAKVAGDLSLRGDDLISLEKTILKLETLMLNKLAEDYEAFKATELWERRLAEAEANSPEVAKIINAARKAKAEGKTELNNWLISHKTKVPVTRALRNYGLTVKELTVGNTFLIAWPESNRKNSRLTRGSI